VIDTLCHLENDAFDADRDSVLLAAAHADVSDMLNAAITAADWEKILHITAASPAVHAALGLHPALIDQHCDEDLARLEQLLTARADVIAIGEIGLDFFDKSLDRDKQMHFFSAQLQLAAKHQLPVILHVRKAHDDVLRLLRAHPVKGGTVHAFNGSLQHGEHYHALGFCLGFGGMLTYAHSNKLRNLARSLPASALVLETDSPDMTGQAHRGARNSPAYLPEVRDSLAALRQESSQEVAAYTTANVRRIFGLPLR
jgi:TatD DNase family protein